MKTQGEDRRLQAKESSLRRRRDLRLLTSRTEGNRFLLLEPPGLGHFVTAASADEDNQVTESSLLGPALDLACPGLPLPPAPSSDGF